MAGERDNDADGDGAPAAGRGGPSDGASSSGDAGILEGITVLDFSQVLSGPTVTRYLMELGAQVIKVERPPHGDITRASAHVRDGRSGYFVQVNRGKRSLCVDLGQPRGRELVLELVERVDVLVENFSPGAIGRLGFDWETVHARNPRLVMCSLSGFGQHGPLAHLPGYDGVAQAYAGITALNGEPDRPPIVAGAAFGDVLTGVNGVSAVLGALFHRERTGRGQRVEVSLLDAYIQAQESAIQAWSASGGEVRMRRGGRFHPLACPYGIFRTVDGHVFITAAADHHWSDLCQAMGRPELADDPRFRSRAARQASRDEVHELIERWLADFASTDEAVAALGRHRVPAGPVLAVEDVVTHPGLRAVGTIRTVSDPVLGRLDVPGFPLRFGAADGQPDRVAAGRVDAARSDLVDGPAAGAAHGDVEAPFLGEHNRAVVVDLLGRSPEDYDALVAGGVLRAEPVHPRASRQRPLGPLAAPTS